MLYSHELIEDVRIQNEIVGFISTYITLKQKGSSYFGLCPFHNEHSPSFSVNSDRQIYHCFGCGESGNVITFTMKMENLDFPDAIKLLAQRARISLPEPTLSREERKKSQQRQVLFEINKQAARFFYDSLLGEGGRLAQQYLIKRGITKKTVTQFGLGYAASGRNSVYEFLRNKNYDDEILELSGLVIKDKNGNGFYDRFFSRLMFPIIDVGGRITGFGGRILDRGEPKYLNSPETQIFDKKRCLYGINFAKVSRKSIILVEGYMDVIALQQAGFTNAVAALGTALSNEHGRLLRKYTDDVIILFDSDSAGEKAALRAISVLCGVGFRPKVLQVTNAKDPDEFISHYGRDEFENLLNTAENYVSFQISCIRKPLDMNNTEDRILFSNRAAEVLSSVENKIERDAYIKEVGQISGISEGAILTEVQTKETLRTRQELPPINKLDKRYKLNTSSSSVISGSAKESEGLIKAQEDFINFLADSRRLYLKIKDVLNPEDFSGSVYTRLVAAVYQRYEDGMDLYPAELINHFTEPEEQKLVAGIFSKRVAYDTPAMAEKNINDQLRVIKRASIERQSRTESDLKEVMRLINDKINIDKLYIKLEDG